MNCEGVRELDLPFLILIALGLSADCFAVALSISISRIKISAFNIVRAALMFGLFQALMPFLGWLAGQTVVDFIASFDHWVVFALLALIGGKMIWESLRPEETGKSSDISKLGIVLFLALATSIDALAVGLSFAFIKVAIAFACAIIGIVAFLIAITGFMLGKKAGKLIGKRAGIIGGIILIAIGLRILLSHIL